MPFNIGWVACGIAAVLSLAALISTRGKRPGPVLAPWVLVIIVLAVADPSSLENMATAVWDFGKGIIDKAING